MGAFQLDLGTNGAQVPVQLAIPLQNTQAAEAGDEVLFFRRGTVFGLDAQLHDTWWLVDNGFIGTDGIARTASPPYGGISMGGSFLMIKKPGAAPREVTLVSLNPDDFATVFDYGFSLAGVMLNLAGIIASNAVSMLVGSLRFGLPDVVATVLKPMPGGQVTVYLSAALPPTITPFGNVLAPNLSAASYDPESGKLRFSIDESDPVGTCS